MLFCQFAKSQSVRDISNGLHSATGNLNHLGVDKAPSKSTIRYQNKHCPWELFKDYYFVPLESFGQQTRFKQVNFKIKSKIFLLDSTTISLCQSLFDWAKYKTSMREKLLVVHRLWFFLKFTKCDNLKSTKFYRMLINFTRLNLL